MKNIRGVYFNWKEGFGQEKRRNIGVIAQEVEKEFPEIVSVDNNGTMFMTYELLTPILIEAVKELGEISEEQQDLIVSQNNTINQLSLDNQEMRKENQAMKKSLCKLGAEGVALNINN